MYLLRFAFKNTFRKTWRSVITAISVLVGVMMIVFAWAMIDGLDSAVIYGQINCDTGHFRVMAQGYLDTEEDAEIDFLIEDEDAAEIVLRQGEIRLHPRLTFKAELSDGRHGLMARGIAIEPEAYFADFTLPMESELEGENETGLDPMWIGVALASNFGVEPGDTLTVLARTRYGSYTADEYLIEGLVRSQNPAIDNTAFFIPLDVAQALLDSQGALTELVGFLPRRALALDLPSRLGPELAERGLEIQTWRERAEPILRINRMRRKMLAVLIGIIMLVSATGIANTVVMAGFERIKEVGTLRALGFQTEGVVVLFLFEAFLIGIVGAAAGSAVGSALVHSLRDGLDLSSMTTAGNYAVSFSSVIYLELDPGHVAIAFLIGLGMTVIAALYPSLKFSRLSPVEAMRR